MERKKEDDLDDMVVGKIDRQIDKQIDRQVDRLTEPLIQRGWLEVEGTVQDVNKETFTMAHLFKLALSLSLFFFLVFYFLFFISIIIPTDIFQEYWEDMTLQQECNSSRGEPHP